MGVHDSYGKKVLERAGKFQHWFVEEELTVNYPPGGMKAKLDGLIGKHCVVEVEGLNEKQIRSGILDLVFHPRPKKLLIIAPANLSKSNRPEDVQKACQRLLDDLIRALCPSAIGGVVVLSGTGHNQEEFLDEDCTKVQQELKRLGC